MATISVTGRDARVSSGSKKYAREKITRLAKYFNGIGKIEATLGHSGDTPEVEVVISVPRCSPMVCRSRAKDFFAAVDLVLDKAEAQLTKHKERIKTRKTHRGEAGTARKRTAPLRVAPSQDESEDDSLESYDDVIEKRDFS